MKVLQFPLARITIAYILGILIAYSIQPTPLIILSILTVTSFIFSVIYFANRLKTKLNPLFGIATFFLTLVIGSATLTTHTDHFQKDNYSNYTNIYAQNHTFIITLREKLKSSKTSHRYMALVNSIDNQKSSGRIILNIQNDSIANTFGIGHQLKINATLYKNNTQKNPNQFDYQKYLENKQVYAQLFIEKNKIQIASEIKKDIWYYTFQIRNRIVQNLSNSNFNPRELNVAMALILGQQQDLDPEIIHDYQYAGAVHILSVSGLHIGCLMLLITFLLKPIPNTKNGALFKLLFVLVSLLLFGILAGLAPSVIRSITMFSFVAIGHFLRRSVNIYHTLLVSMLLILLFQPYFLFDVGFQLSYMALFFIVWIQPLLANLWSPKQKFLKPLWSILTVSFAAQIGTLPISIYYFHQFPGLFFVTNLIILPVLSYIMGLGVVVMLLAAFHLTPSYLIKALEISIYYMNKAISGIASLEQFIFKDIPLNILLLLSCYFVIITLFVFLQHKRLKNFFWVLLAIIITQITALTTKWEVQKQKEFIVFNTIKNTQLVKRIGNKAVVYTNQMEQKKQVNTPINTYLTANFSTVRTKENIKNMYYFEGKKILLIDSTKSYPSKIRPDILIITQSPRLNMERVLKDLRPRNVVADASNYKSLQKIWSRTCLQQKIPFHATNEKGFYRIQ